jgi:lipid-A-disaccharide synthase|tara:strand:+ start:4321 stop:5451 length:1131 start_codon:yes stop_codon:yes gene_type:complete
VPKVAILAGEPSGDLIASHLMTDLNKQYKNIQYIGVGGPLMKSKGLSSFFDYAHLSVRGYFEVFRNIIKLRQLQKNLIDFLISEKPDVFIGIDAPDFNFAIERALKAKKVRVFHYISPSVWAWRKNRIFQMKKDMHHLFSIFPHELPIFKKIRLPVTYVGHPLASKIPLKPDAMLSRKLLNISKVSKIIALLPGSRMGEVRWHLDTMLKTAQLMQKSLPECLFLLPVNNQANYGYALSQLRNYHALNVRLIIGHSHDVINASDICLLASGTASLEAALYKKPMVVMYKTSWFSWLILKRMHLIPFVALPNILLGKLLVPELLQYEASPQKLAQKLLAVCSDKKYLNNLSGEYKKLHLSLKKNTSHLIIDQLNRYLK